MRILKLYGTGSATANGVVTFTMPWATTIRMIQTAVRVDSVTDNAYLNLELSYSSAREIATNNAQQCVLELAWANNLLTSGMTASGINQWFPGQWTFKQGQFLYLHALVTGTLTYDSTFLLHCT